MDDKEIGIYIHIPFCKQKCLYCDFPSYAGAESYMEPYLNALLEEMTSVGGKLSDYNIKSIYIGGGTPTYFKTSYIGNILETCYLHFNIEDDAEITIEANPGTLDRRKLLDLKSFGINRLSLGVQAWQNRLLKFLGRIHDSQQVVSNIQWARDAGFDNISVDIMFGLPNQTVEEWMDTLRNVCSLKVEHISAYSLKIEEGTALCTMVQDGVVQPIDESTERYMYHEGISFLKDRGYIQYEISNFAKGGRKSVHNLIYWKDREYMGFGCSAHSYIDRMRQYNYQDIEQYIYAMNKNGQGVEHKEYIARDVERFEMIMMGLRLTEGVNKLEFKQRFGSSLDSYYGDIISLLKEDGLLEEDHKAIFLTPRGMDIQNTILLDFLDYMG